MCRLYTYQVPAKVLGFLSKAFNKREAQYPIGRNGLFGQPVGKQTKIQIKPVDGVEDSGWELVDIYQGEDAHSHGL